MNTIIWHYSVYISEDEERSGYGTKSPGQESNHSTYVVCALTIESTGCHIINSNHNCTDVLIVAFCQSFLFSV